MENFEKDRQAQLKSMFFILKIMAMFFFSIPLIEYLLSSTSGNPTEKNEISTSLVVVFILLSGIAFLWILMDKKRSNYKAVLFLEMILFFGMCLASVWCSGAITSYYKFAFIFMIVLYTIEFGMKLGMLLAVISAMTLLIMDLIFYTGGGVNKYFENDLVLSAVFIIVAWTLGFYVKMEKMQIHKLENDANFDGLTQIYNHRYFYDIIKSLCAKSVKEKKDLSLLMLDIDHFKIYNDIYGHQKGDEILKFLTQLLQKNLRKNDILCRYGGEEFTILLPDTNLDDAIVYAKSIRNVVADTYFQGQEHMPSQNFTISIGVAAFKGEKDSYKELIDRADSALYRAKFLRRNSVEIYSSIFEELNTLESHNQVLQETFHSLKTLITVINSRDAYTFNHIERVVYLCKVVANHLHLSADEKKRLIYAAYLHDLGKINISKEILISDQKLTQQQWEELKQHPAESAEIIKKVEGFQDIVPIVLQHHERYDGTGYPNHLKGNQICYLARILVLADSFDAMTSKRPYQPIKSYEEAFAEIRKCSGTQFDPSLCEPFIEAIESIKENE